MKATRMGLVLCGLVVNATGMPPAAIAQEPSSMQMADALAVPNLRRPNDRILSGGQPGPEAWRRLAANGVTTVINLRPAAEMNGRNEASEVTAEGMSYLEIPVSGAVDITTANGTALWRAIHDAPGAVLVHCASGNRVGALLAIGAAREGGMAKREALEFGKSAGLSNAEPRVREVLKRPAE